MIDVTHDRNDRRTCCQIFRCIGLIFFKCCCFFSTLEFHFKAVFAGNQFNNLGIQTLVNTNHYAQLHTGLNNLHCRYIHQAGQFAYRHKLGNA